MAHHLDRITQGNLVLNILIDLFYFFMFCETFVDELTVRYVLIGASNVSNGLFGLI
jgi:hypothetical protein